MLLYIVMTASFYLPLLGSHPLDVIILQWWRAINSLAYADVHPVWHDCLGGAPRS